MVWLLVARVSSGLTESGTSKNAIIVGEYRISGMARAARRYSCSSAFRFSTNSPASDLITRLAGNCGRRASAANCLVSSWCRL
eukprot:CAMPEP_0175095326 /NCGR_PEP_ID=MMETSP0086_2-20121207/4088_1 /TAXON_ID=136419 /ORGANISM="Unknown Unknown, Strain D1" /LENGTH=82 /DNA_ID=CAMNT_0016368551 /DNA_START=643 /DNA_END=891 /DNA_ORIENTATION=-